MPASGSVSDSDYSGSDYSYSDESDAGGRPAPKNKSVPPVVKKASSGRNKREAAAGPKAAAAAAAKGGKDFDSDEYTYYTPTDDEFASQPKSKAKSAAKAKATAKNATMAEESSTSAHKPIQKNASSNKALALKNLSLTRADYEEKKKRVIAQVQARFLGIIERMQQEQRKARNAHRRHLMSEAELEKEIRETCKAGSFAPGYGYDEPSGSSGAGPTKGLYGQPLPRGPLTPPLVAAVAATQKVEHPPTKFGNGVQPSASIHARSGMARSAAGRLPPATASIADPALAPAAALQDLETGVNESDLSDLRRMPRGAAGPALLGGASAIPSASLRPEPTSKFVGRTGLYGETPSGPLALTSATARSGYAVSSGAGRGAGGRYRSTSPFDRYPGTGLALNLDDGLAQSGLSEEDAIRQRLQVLGSQLRAEAFERAKVASAAGSRETSRPGSPRGGRNLGVGRGGAVQDVLRPASASRTQLTPPGRSAGAPPRRKAGYA